MLVYLPIAQMAVDAETVALLGVVVGVISGIFGVGGGFLTTPFLIFLGIPPTIAVGTQASQLVASSTTSVIGYWRNKNVDFKIACVMLSGGICGTVTGIFVFKILQYFGQIDLAIAVLYVVFLCSIGSMMLLESVATLIRLHRQKTGLYAVSLQEIDNEKSNRNQWQDRLPFKISFPESRLYISALLPIGVGFTGGLMVSVMGIGAGFLLVPAMIYFLRMPPLLVAGTSLLQIIVTSAIACILHAVTNQTVDLILGLILIIGSVLGAQIGVRLSRYIRGAIARFLLALIIMIVGLKLSSALLIPPANLYSIVMVP